MKKGILALIFTIFLLYNIAYGEKPIKNHLYIGGKEGLYIVKFKKIDKLEIEKHLLKDTGIITTHVEDNYLYIGDKNGVYIYSLKDPENPELISRFVPQIEKYPYPSSYPHKIFIERNRMYIPYGISGILIVDLRDKKVPSKMGIYNDNNVFYDMVARDRYIYTASSEGLVIINAKEPKNPKKVTVLIPKTKKDAPFSLHLSVRDNYLFVVKRDTLSIYNIREPETPKLIKSKKVGDNIEYFLLYEDYLFAVDDNGFTLRVFELQINKKKTKKGTEVSAKIKKVGTFKANYPIEDLVYFMNYIYLSMGKYGIEIVNIDNIEHIFKKKTLNLYTDCISITKDNKFIYAVDEKDGLIILDKKKMVPINWYRTLKGAVDFYKDKKYGYFLQKGYLSALSIKEDGEPYRIDGISNIPPRAFRLYKKEDDIYVCALDYGLFFYSTKKDKTAPKLVKKYATDGNLYDLYPEGNIIYMADGKAGFFVIDITDKKGIKVLRRYKTKSPVTSIYKIDDIIYLGEKNGTLEIISLENPKKIEVIGTMKFTSPIVRIKKDGNYLFLALGEGGVKALKITSVYTVPTLASSIDTKGYAWNIVIDGDILWIADGENGIVVYDISDITTPKELKDLDWFSAHTIEIK